LHYTGAPDYGSKELAARRGVVVEDVRDALQQFVPADQRVVAFVVPSERAPIGASRPGRQMKRALALGLGVALAACGDDATRFGPPAKLARPAYTVPAGAPAQALADTAPATGEFPPLRMPAVHDTRLACGARLLAIERHKPLLVVVVRAVIDRGTADLPPGVGALLAQSVFTGTKRRSDIVVGQELNEMGAKRSVDAEYDSITITIEVPSANLDGAARLLADVLRNADFPDEPTVRVRQHLLAELDHRKMAPRALAFDALLPQIFPEGHPFRDPEDGSIASVGPRTPAELRDARRALFVPKRVSFVVAGDFDEKTLVARLDKELEGWQGEGPPAAVLPKVDKRPRRIVVYDHPGDSQVAMAIGCPGVARKSEDAPPMRLLASLLGGGMTGRLNRSIRLGHGTSYGIGAQSDLYRGAGVFTITGSVERDHAAEALEDVFVAIERVRVDKLDRRDVPAARAHESVRVSLSLATLGQLAGFLSNAAVHAETPESVFTRMRASEGVSLDDIHRAANRWLSPDAMQVVLVGDASKIVSKLGKDVGEVEVRALR
jgi:predicted Zn-dependent peptidase